MARVRSMFVCLWDHESQNRTLVVDSSRACAVPAPGIPAPDNRARGMQTALWCNALICNDLELWARMARHLPEYESFAR